MTLEPIVFTQDIDPDFDALSARIGDLQVSIEMKKDGPVVAVFAYGRRSAVPCEDDVSACPAGKEFDDEDGYDKCEGTCPYIREVEEIDSSEFIWGDTLEELVLEARERLPQNAEAAPDVAEQFIKRDWIVDGKRLAAPPSGAD